MFENAEIRLRAPGFRWVTVPVPRGTSLRGMIAGPVRIVDCHTSDGPSKPCRRCITGGKCPCYCDEKPIPIRTYGYLPLVTRDLEEVVVILSKTTTLACKDWPFRSSVEIIAPAREKSRTRIRLAGYEDMPSAVNNHMHKRQPADIRPYLVDVLWHDEVLINWFNEHSTHDRVKTYPPLVKRPRKPLEVEPPDSDTPVSLAPFLSGIGPPPDSRPV
jgi:hypothetical protein